MKILLFSTILFSLSLFSQTRTEALNLYKLRGETLGNAIKAAKLFEELAKNENNKTEKCFLLNKASYLNFFHGSQLDNSEEEIKYLKISMNQADQCREQFMKGYDKDVANELDEKTKYEVALSAYQGGTSLARISEIKGTTAALKNWPQIRRRMKFIIKIKKAEVSNYGAHRTLGIANTKMPSPFGNKKKAFKYLSLSVNKTIMNGRGISRYIFNSISLAEYYFKTKKKIEACAVLKEINEITLNEFKKEVPDLYYENKVDQQRSIKFFNEFNC